MANIPPNSPAGPEQEPAAGAEPSRSERDRIVDAFMALLATERFENIAFPLIASRAGISLGVLRRHFGSKLAILARFVRDVDRKVLDGHDADMADEPARERLFDVLMRRIEVLAPHREAVRSLMESAQRDPCLALALNAMSVQSQQWMLAAADVNSAGPRGMLRAQGLAVLFARVLQTFVHDDDPGHARTMAALDRQLSRGERLSGFFDQLCRFAPSRFVPRGFRERRRDGDLDDGTVPV